MRRRMAPASATSALELARARRATRRRRRGAPPGQPAPEPQPVPAGRAASTACASALAGGRRRRGRAAAHRAPPAARDERPARRTPRPTGRAAAARRDPVGDLGGDAAATAELDVEETRAPGRGRATRRSSGRRARGETVRSWDLPALDAAGRRAPVGAAQMDLTAKGQRIRETLAHFGIGVKMARIQEGPVVTQYALDVEPGIKLSRIEGLADNLALALAARIDPDPGADSRRGLRGDRDPEQRLRPRHAQGGAGEPQLRRAWPRRAASPLRSARTSPASRSAPTSARCRTCSSPAPPARARASASTPSICSPADEATPAEVKFILIDPKRVEMAQYRGSRTCCAR